VTAGGLTILRTVGGLLATKRFTWHATQVWLKKPYGNAAKFTIREVTGMTGIDDLANIVQRTAADPHAMIVRGALTASRRAMIETSPATLVRRRKKTRDGIEPDFVEVPRQWFMVDIDNFQLRACDDLVDDPESAVEYAIGEILPPCFQDVRCFWQLSASAGFERDVLKVHLFYWLTEPLTDAVLKRTLQQHAPGITDLSVYQGVQPHYVASPIIEGGPDPIPRRFGWIKGAEDALALPALGPDEPGRCADARDLSNGASSGLGGDPLTLVGDGEGLAGFHLPLRTAALAYARRVRHGAARDDAEFLATCRNAIDGAPRRPDRDVSGYDDDYVARSIAGAFEWLDGLVNSGSTSPVPQQSRERNAPDPRRREAARMAFRLMRRGIPSDELLTVLHRLNEQRHDPLPPHDIGATVLWVARLMTKQADAR
jgi:hypothetical protein